ncbi:MAG: serine hydrolase domain-containing protein [Bacteroidota bacterium]|nr:serine hydrolase domain-containing protein [Bacteroidota bacterium]
MKHLIILILSLVIGITELNAQTKSVQKSLVLTEGTPESVGMSTERLARIDSLCVKAIAEDKIPGAVALVVRNGNIVYYKAFGMADNQTGRALKRDDIFRIASQSKAITATAVMMLWEEGKFNLDDPISKYIPEFKNPKVVSNFNSRDTSYTTVAAKSEITIRQLLDHSSGLGYGVIGDDVRCSMIYQKAGIIDAFSSENRSIEENVKKLAVQPLLHHPGEKFTYSEGLDVLGYFVEIMSGMPFDVFLRTCLFEPLGMNDTWFYLPEDKAHRLVPVQKSDKGKWIRYPITFYDPDYPIKGAKRYLAGGAGLSSTAKDYAVFLQMYLNGGELNGIRFLSRTTIQSILAFQVGNLWGNENDLFYSLAFSVVTQSGQDKGGQGSAGTFGWGGYFNTSYFADPKEKIIGILLKQTQDTFIDDTEGKFHILVGQAIDD